MKIPSAFESKKIADEHMLAIQTQNVQGFVPSILTKLEGTIKNGGTVTTIQIPDNINKIGRSIIETIFEAEKYIVVFNSSREDNCYYLVLDFSSAKE